MFVDDDVQLNDVAFFCVNKNGVLSIDITFNLCSNRKSNERKGVRKKEPEILIDRNNCDSDRAHVMRVENQNASRPV